MTRPFRFGVISEHMPPAAAWFAFVRRIEQLGFDTLLVRDHLLPGGFGEAYAPFSALAAAAAITTQLRIGSLVLCNDFRHPALLAREALTLDVLSGGRFELGLGAGWMREEYERAGIPFDPPGTRIARLDASVAILRGLFADEPFNSAGAHYRITDLHGYPRPARRGGPPILLGGGHERMLRLAGRVADIVGIMTTSVASGDLVDDPRGRMPAAVEQKIAWIREGAGERFAQLELSAVVDIIIATDRQAAAERLIARRGWHGIDSIAVLEMPLIFIGTIEQIATQMIERRARYGLSYYIIGDADAAAVAPIMESLRDSASVRS